MNFQLQNSLLIFFGCGIGGLCRYWVSNSVYLFLGRQFPYGTFAVNVSGALLAGLLLSLILDRFAGIGPQLRAFLLIGFLGGYTTFSTFSIETVTLLETSNCWLASINMLLSTSLCIGAAWLGIFLGRNL